MNHHPPTFAPASPLPRRTFLRGTGVALSLPLLDAMIPAGFAKQPTTAPKRILTVCTTYGLHAPLLFPDTAGRNYESTPYLDLLADLRDEFTIFSGLSHPGVDGGHSAEATFLTAAPHPASSSFRNTISLDQFILEQHEPDTRFPFLALGTRYGSLSWTRGGVQIPAEHSPARLFAKLFVQGTKDEVIRQVERLREGRSVMDAVAEQAKRLQNKLGARDRDKLDQYLTAVREVEGRLVKAEAWEHKPKATVAADPPIDAPAADIIGQSRLMYDMIRLAFETDSTRIITLSIDGSNAAPPIEGVSQGHHNLTHHGRDPSKIDQLRIIEEQELRALADFLRGLKGAEDAVGGGKLLDSTMILFGSNLGNASSHDNRNLPVILAGGDFQHGRHIARDRVDNAPLCNVFVSMMQKLGLEVERFASSTGTVTELG